MKLRINGTGTEESSLTKSQVLVTGGCGFIGGKVVGRFQSVGIACTVIDLVPPPSNVSLNRYSRFVQADIRNHDQILKVMKESRPQIVIHLAAQTEVLTSINDPILDASTNVMGSLNVILTAAQVDVKRFVYVNSGGAIYSPNAAIPLTESSPIFPISPYGASKIAGEYFSSTVANASQMDLISLRLSNVYGSSNSKGVINKFLLNVLGDLPCCIYGDGNSTRDYIYIQDVIDAIELSIDKISPGIYNLSSGKETSLNSLVELISQVTGKNALVNFEPRNSGEVMNSALDNSKLLGQGWTPKVGLINGIKMLHQDSIGGGKVVNV